MSARREPSDAPHAERCPALLFGASWPAWQRERAARLHRIFTNVERRIKNGIPIPRVFKHPSWYNRQRFYRCAPSKRRLFAVGTLVQNFYRWRKNGRTPAALGLKYRAWNKGAKKR